LLAHKKVVKGVCIFAAFIIAVSFIRGCLRKPQKPKIPPRRVQTGEVIRKDVPIYLDTFGNLRALYDVDIVAQVEGKIMESDFEEGKEVSEGDLLFIVDPRPYKAQLDKAESRLAENLADLKLQKDNLERNRRLVVRDLISEQDFEKFQTIVDGTEAKTGMNKADIEQAKIDLEYCYIHSPIDGLAGKRLVDPGNIVEANTGPVLVNIKSIAELDVDFTLPERNFYKVKKAMAEDMLKVEIHPEGYEGEPFTGELEFIDNAVDNTTGTISLRAIVSNKERELWADQFIRVRLILGIKKNAVLAPYKAVRLGQKGAYLFVVKDGKADLRLLTTGQQEKEYIIVEKGVEVGEKVVTEGQLGLSPGMSVVDVTDQAAEEKQGKSGKKK